MIRNLIQSRYRDTVLAHRPALYWPLTERIGAVAGDLMSTANLNYAGGYTLSAGGIIDAGGCVKLNGSTGNLTAAYNAALPTGAGARTIVAWINLDNLAGMAVFGYGESAISKEFTFEVSSAGNLLVLPNGGTTSLSGLGKVLAGRWHQVAVSYDGTRLTGYIDGARQGSSAYALNTGTTLNMRIGRRAANGSDWLAGRVSHVAVFSRALSDAELLNLYKAGTNPGKTTPPANPRSSAASFRIQRISQGATA